MNALETHARGRRVCVVLDEFQDILEVRDGEQVLALMRSRIQLMPRTVFVFLGSARNRMLDVFMSPKSRKHPSANAFLEASVVTNDTTVKRALKGGPFETD